MPRSTTEAPRSHGFHTMGDQAHRAACAKGGRNAHRKKVAHRFTPEEARAAGRKGGLVRRAKVQA